MIRELRGEGVPENRGGGSGVWTRETRCEIGEVRAIHWRLSGGLYTELSVAGHRGFNFPDIYLLGHVECDVVDLWDLYVAEFYKLGTPQLFVSMLNSVSKQARKDGERAAQMRMRSALGFEEDES